VQTNQTKPMKTNHTKLESPAFRAPLLSALAFALALSVTPGRVSGAEPAKDPKAADVKAAAAAEGKAKESKVAAAKPSRKVLVFRNIRSWKRKVDFEEALDNSGFKFDVKPSAEMATTELAPYGVVIIPGAQWQDDFYRDYAENAARFDRYVTNGGTLVLELNGAERDGITLPRGVRMTSHGSKDNALLLPEHPILLPLGGKPIHASYASHGFLEGVPKDAIVLVAEMSGDQPVLDMPTFVEYSSGAGRVIAACQCFHDQDNSGRGPLMDTVLSYAAEREWYSRKK